MILRCGALYGFYGHIKQIAGAQEVSKNLLTEARHRFLETAETEKMIECENYLALAYWRTGELVEAATWIGEALSRAPARPGDAWLYSHLTKSLIDLSKTDYATVEENLKRLENAFQKFGNYFLNGSFCANLSIALRNLGKRPEAMKYLELARFYHQKSRHQIYLGTVENNLAYLYKSDRKYSLAHQAIDNASKIFRQLKDRTREGFSLDTKAAIFFDQGKYPEALETVEKAIFLLKKSENAAYLCETLLTKSKIQLHLEGFSSAVLALCDAVQLARTQISEETAKKLVEQFEALLDEKNNPVQPVTQEDKEIAGENLELLLPAALSHHRDLQGVWIKNSHFEAIGLKKGSLAVVARGKVTRGDLVAVSEIANDAVICGFYDAEFGIVCLEGAGSEPLLFDENEISVLGKIIGVCRTEKGSGGKLPVEPLQL